MTSLYLLRDGQVLLLYRKGSRAIADSWVGIGGHLESDELNDPRCCIVREVKEEIGLSEDSLEGLALRYLAVRDRGDELRITYYFFAHLAPGAKSPDSCDEGVLEWCPLTTGLLRRDMPPTTSVVLRDYLSSGAADERLRTVVMSSDGPRVLPLAVG